MPLPAIAAAAIKFAPMISGLLKGKGKGGGGGEGIQGKVGDLKKGPSVGGLGLAQTLAGKMKQKQADSMMPGAENSEERSLVNYYKRRKRAYQTGTANSTQGSALAAMTKSGVEASMKSGARSSTGLNQMGDMYKNGMLGLTAQNQQGEMGMAKFEDAGVRKLADRKLQIGLLRYNTMQARAAEQLKTGKSNTNAALAGMMGKEEDTTAVPDTAADTAADTRAEEEARRRRAIAKQGGGGSAANTGGEAAAND